jgi:hypothetical protein
VTKMKVGQLLVYIKGTVPRTLPHVFTRAYPSSGDGLLSSRQSIRPEFATKTCHCSVDLELKRDLIESVRNLNGRFGTRFAAATAPGHL